ncbi:SKI/DACH domain-containing protein 1-like [Zingiber officinale]|uniref:SKI/DACH domain-containing protein 1-like n=1 Tax=Zingiber officinale TaxID=94328 RepID=UPI001C4CFF1B|nr:SKI/DACH domain-containing protein 1-like [Zingiber officinale]
MQHQLPSPCQGHGRHHNHHHHHIPLFVLCPCACHQRHHQHHQLPSLSSPFLPRPSSIACSTLPHLLPNESSPRPLHDHFSQRHVRTHSSRMADEAKVAEFSAAESEEQELNEDRVDDDCGGRGGDDDDEEEVVFVLTEEWREFFAKSEAKRKLAKQQKSGT